MKDKVHRKSTLDTLYYNQADAIVEPVPPNLPLSLLLEKYNEIASFNFAACQDDQHTDITRMIWFYGLDQNRSFSRYFRQVRFNIIMIAYHWANNFDELDPDVAYFLHCFIIAWMDYAMDPMRAKNNDFLLQEQFIEMWEASNYDLIHFTNAQLTTVAKLLDDLRRRELNPKLKSRLYDGIVDLMNDRRQGRMSDEDWAKYGPKLAILMTMTIDDIGHTFQAEHNREKQ
ncbi:hypothetical protein E8E11_004201 [Didymella keratinophila]|nr:hypothetical protein E8E11_004201 [Didymella keratinophila]